MITAMTTTKYEKQLKDTLLTLNPKPDIWIIYNDLNPVKENKNTNDVSYDPSQYFSKIADNYNKLKSIIPKDTVYVVLIEDDIIFLNKDILEISIKDLECVNCDILVVPTKHRHLREGTYVEHPMIWNFDIKEGKKAGRWWLNYSGLKPIDGSACGYIFMKREVIENIDFSYSNKTMSVAVDEFFFYRAKRLGYTIYCDFDVKTNHQGRIWNGKIKNISNEWYEKTG